MKSLERRIESVEHAISPAGVRVVVRAEGETDEEFKARVKPGERGHLVIVTPDDIACL
ncbi:hypothetical protein [Desulfurivibrio sp. C05AmB]|uniref:hypothetical protein n=1 Tax=Desulfurivibrio sp. C05AmB TaxID=3374371 RepID=UPI00376EE5BC